MRWRRTRGRLPAASWVQARGFVAQPVRRIASGPLRVRLERGGAVTGVVREGDGGRPIPGARFGLESDLPGLDPWSADAVRSVAVTDAEGASGSTGSAAARRRIPRAPAREPPSG